MQVFEYSDGVLCKNNLYPTKFKKMTHSRHKQFLMPFHVAYVDKWNIQTSGQYSHFDSTKPLKTIRRLSNVRKLLNIIRALSFLFALRQISDTCRSNLRSLSIFILLVFPNLVQTKPDSHI